MSVEIEQHKDGFWRRLEFESYGEERRARREQYTKEICACSIFGAMNRDGERFTGEGVIKSIANMHVRGNGLGGGFAAYGIYPDYKDYYALHLMFTGSSREAKRCAKQDFDAFLYENFDVVYDEEIPHGDETTVSDPPLIWRYFALPNKHGDEARLSDEDYIVNRVMRVNTSIENATCSHRGKTWDASRAWDFLRRSASTSCSIASTKHIPGRYTVVFPPIHRPGGEGPTHSAFWIQL
jgi:glutamate synthase domain-containing protein 1